MEEGDSSGGKGSVERAEKTLRPRLHERSKRHSEFPHSQPPHASIPVLAHAHIAHRLQCQIAETERVLAQLPPPFPSFFLRHLPLPQHVPDQVVLADIGAEEVDALVVGEVVEVGGEEHGGFADNAGGEEDGVDGCVEFGVRGRHEEFFQAAAADGTPVAVVVAIIDGVLAGGACRGTNLAFFAGNRVYD